MNVELATWQTDIGSSWPHFRGLCRIESGNLYVCPPSFGRCIGVEIATYWRLYTTSTQSRSVRSVSHVLLYQLWTVISLISPQTPDYTKK